MQSSIMANLAHSSVAREAATKLREVPFALKNWPSLPDDSYVDIKVIAGLLGCGISTVWARIKRGDPLIPKPRKFGRSTRFNVGKQRAALAEGA